MQLMPKYLLKELEDFVAQKKRVRRLPIKNQLIMNGEVYVPYILFHKIFSF